MNSTTKKARIAGELGCFVRRYARKAQKQRDANDRRYDKRVETAMQRMRPEDLSDLLTDDGVDWLRHRGAPKRPKRCSFGLPVLDPGAEIVIEFASLRSEPT
jgi:hypothetical protein